ncbi:MAG: hypothetical protein CFE44_26760, partial [Burkholderiales bacterium PBB4]
MVVPGGRAQAKAVVALVANIQLSQQVQSVGDDVALAELVVAQIVAGRAANARIDLFRAYAEVVADRVAELPTSMGKACAPVGASTARTPRATAVSAAFLGAAMKVDMRRLLYLEDLLVVTHRLGRWSLGCRRHKEGTSLSTGRVCRVCRVPGTRVLPGKRSIVPGSNTLSGEIAPKAQGS